MQSMHVFPNYYTKKIYFFSSQSIRMSGNSTNFNNQKNQKKLLPQQKQKNI